MKSGNIIKICILFAIACAATVIILSCRSVTQAEEDHISHKYYTSVEIQPGDSLWSIACTYSDGHYSTIQEYIEELKMINNLSSDLIHAYEYLVIPYYSADSVSANS